MFGPFDFIKSSAELTYPKTDRAKVALAVAFQFALEQRSMTVEPEHILRALGSIDRGVGRRVLDGLGVDLFQLLPQIVELLPPLSSEYPHQMPQLGEHAITFFNDARTAANELNQRYVGTEHLVLSLLCQETPASTFLRDLGITYKSAIDGVRQLLGGHN